MEQILIVEDDKDLNLGLYRALKEEKRQIISCCDLHTAREQLLCGIPDLILLDLNLPDGNGIALLKELCKKFNKPAVILLTANDTDEDVVNGLEQGADDYITKPFSLAVLRARVNTQLRRKSNEKIDAGYLIGNYAFDFSSQRFSVDKKSVELSKTEQKLLRLLLDNKGHTVERSTLIDHIWTDGADFVDENALSVAIKRLRDKLNAHRYIKTVYGIGYVWVNDDE